MTQREKTMMTGLVAALLLGGGAGALYVFALEPVKVANERVSSARQQLNDKIREWEGEQDQIRRMAHVNPRLPYWSQISLPPRLTSLIGKSQLAKMSDGERKQHYAQLQVDYEKYLSDLMQRNRFQPDSIKVSLRQIEKTSTAKGKQPVYERIGFGVSGRGKLENVASFLEEFHKAQLLHQVRSITVESTAGKTKNAKEGELDVKMNVEAVLVTGAKDRSTLHPPKMDKTVTVLADPPRDYALMDKKNMFFGIKPPKKIEPEKPKPKDDRKDPPPPKKEPPREKPQDVLSFVKVTMICYDPEEARWMATLYDQGKGGPEMAIDAVENRKLVIYDRYKETSLNAEVIYIDEKQIIIQTAKAYYRLQVGDFLYPAVTTSYTASELRRMGILK